MPFTLGLTGGIASGKSLVGQAFSKLGITVIDADQASRDVVIPGSDGLKALVTHFGDEILDTEGFMDRARMRERVFGNPEARVELEKLLHPFIQHQLIRSRDHALQSGAAAYCVLMVPLLVKFGWTDLVDRLLVVDCPEEMQIRRLTARDDIDENLALNMLRSQDSRAQRLEAADDVILNDGSAKDLNSHVQKLHRHYKQLGQGLISELSPQKYE